jgi:tRNA threonylcarbamoyladenosine modification (KEOPS) complex  Pcc1 subunit
MAPIKWNAKASILIPVASKNTLLSLFRVLQPEISVLGRERARVIIRRKRRSLQLEFFAKDAIALRAVMNSFLRLISASIAIIRIVRGTQHYRDRHEASSR